MHNLLTGHNLMPTGATVTSSAENRQRTDDRRAGRYAARHWLWDHSKVNRVRACGRVRRGGDGGGVAVRVRVDADGTRSAGWAGLQHCGSVWGCPVCSAKVAAGRQDEIMRALTAWHDQGGRVAVWTGTVQHHAGQSLRSMWDDVGYAWTKTTSGRGWVNDQETYGEPFVREVKGETKLAFRIPTIRVVEVPYGSPLLTDSTGRAGSGWHVHVHAILFLPAGTTKADVQRLGVSMFTRWKAALERRGRSASWAHGFKVSRMDGEPAAVLSDYFTKAVFSTAAEVTRSDLKRSRSGYSMSPFDMLALLVLAETGEMTDDRDGEALSWLSPAVVEDLREAWAEWERVSKGRRQLTWSAGLRARLLGDDAEVTDDELADGEIDGQVVAEVDPDTLAAVMAARADLAILRAFVVSDAAGAGALLPFVLAGERAAAGRAAGRASKKRRE